MRVARRYEDLVIWRLSVKLRKEVLELTAAGPAARDFEFRRQIRESTRSAPRNIAEGFGRYNPRPFAQFLRIARVSLLETRNHLQDGLECGYFNNAAIAPLLSLQRQAQAGCTRLIKYLESCGGHAPGDDP